MFTKLEVKDRYTKCEYCNYTGCSWLIDKHGPIGHWLWVADWYSRKLKRYTPKALYNRLVHYLTRLDYSKIEDIEVDGIDTRDYPEFCDAFIASATYKGKPMSESQLDRLNEDSDFVYQCVQDRLY